MSYREQRMNIYKEIIDNNYNYSKKLELELNKKDAELAALRGFAMFIFLEGFYGAELEVRGLTDENGKPTKLLTGE